MVKACLGNQGPALASRIGTPGTLILECLLQKEEWDTVRQASAARLRKPAPCPSVSTPCRQIAWVVVHHPRHPVAPDLWAGGSVRSPGVNLPWQRPPVQARLGY
jgi:hypothetical protein